jgi:hypothetical protein
MRRALAGGLAALLFASSALAGGAADVLINAQPAAVSGGLSPENGNYSGPVIVQSAAANAGTTAFTNVVFGAAPTNGNTLYALGFSHTSTPTCVTANASAGWVLDFGFTSSPQRALGVAHRATSAGDSATQTPFVATACGGSGATAIAAWEIQGTSAVEENNNIQDGIGSTFTPNFLYEPAGDNRLGLYAISNLNTGVASLAGSAWTHLITSGTVVNGGDYSERYATTFIGSASSSAVFQADMLVLH